MASSRAVPKAVLRWIRGKPFAVGDHRVCGDCSVSYTGPYCGLANRNIQLRPPCGLSTKLSYI